MACNSKNDPSLSENSYDDDEDIDVTDESSSPSETDFHLNDESNKFRDQFHVAFFGHRC